MRGFNGSKRKSFEFVLNRKNENSDAEKEGWDSLVEKAEIVFSSSGYIPVILPDFPQYSENDEKKLREFCATELHENQNSGLNALINSLGMSDWVRAGLEYLDVKDNDNDLCPFCQRGMSAELKNELHGIFDQSYSRQLAYGEQLKDKFEKFRANVQKYYDDNCAVILSESKKNNNDNIYEFFPTALQNLYEVHELIAQKLNNPSQQIRLRDFRKSLDDINDHIEDLKGKERQQESLYRHRADEGTKIIEQSWRLFASEEVNDILDDYKRETKDLQKAISGLECSISQKEKYLEASEKKLEDLRKKATSSIKAVEGINNLLRVSQFHSFHLEHSSVNGENDGYRLIREDGNTADIETLSEGERVFVTFLYFYYSLKEVRQKHETERLVAVIDDPISSLDGDVMFVVSSLVRDLVDSILDDSAQERSAQLIMLTHNARFHNEVTYEKTKRGKTKFYRIHKYSPDPNTVQDCKCDNPVLTSYQELWKVVQDANKNPSQTVPWLPNTLRRILEGYFMTLGGSKGLYSLGKDLPREQRIIHNSLIAWSHSGSHTILDADIFVQNDLSAARWLEAFKNIFIATNNEEHYKMMMGVDGTEE